MKPLISFMPGAALTGAPLTLSAAVGPVIFLAPTDMTVYDAMLSKFAEVAADRLAEM
jgi:hypothetical protein